MPSAARHLHDADTFSLPEDIAVEGKALLDWCASRGGSLDLRDGRLLIRMPGGALSARDRTLLQRHRRVLMRTLAQRQAHERLERLWTEHAPADPAAPAPLTPYQEIFVLLTGQGEHLVVNQTGVFEVRLPELTASAIRQTDEVETGLIRPALERLMQRHSMLRAHLVETAAGTRQMVGKRCSLPLEVHHIPAPDAREAAAEALAEAWRRQPYDLFQAPLWRAAVYPSAGRGSLLLVLGMHHVIMDGWSMGLLARDLSLIIAGLARGREPDLPALRCTYGDYAAWLAAEGLPCARPEQAAFWCQTLCGAPQRHRLPADYARGECGRSRAERHLLCRRTLPGPVMERLRRFAAEHGCGLFAALHTALRVLLYKTAGESDAPILTVAANRQLAGLDDVVGCFVNVLPLCAPFDPEAGPADNLRRGQAVLMDTLDHQLLPFQDIVAASGVRRQSLRHPLSQIFLTLQNAFAAHGQASLEARVPQHAISAYDLAFILWDFGPKGCECHLEYDATLYRPERMEALLEGFGECAAALPDMDRSFWMGDGACAAEARAMDDEDRVEALSRALQLERYAAFSCDGSSVLETMPGALLARACALRGVPHETAEQPLPGGGRRLLAMTRCPSETDLRPDRDLLVVNHLPPACHVARTGLGRRLPARLLLELPGTGLLALADPGTLEDAGEARMDATVLPQPQALAGRPGDPVDLGDGLILPRSRDGRGVSLPLPGHASPLLWRRGHAAHLDALSRACADAGRLACGECVLGLVVPAAGTDMPCIVHGEGEMAVWVHERSAVSEAAFSHLPEALRPAHVMPLKELPRHSDGSFCREALRDIPLYSQDFVRRGLPGAALRRQAASSARRPFYVPVPGCRSMTALQPAEHALPDWDFLFASDHPCLVAPSDTAQDASCLRLLLRDQGWRAVLTGPRARDLCHELDCDRLSCLEPGAPAPQACALLHIVARGGSACDSRLSGALAPGVPVLHWLLTADTATEQDLARRAETFARLHAEIERRNALAPHTNLMIAQRAWDHDGADQAWEVFRAALRSGRDELLADLEPEDVGWHRLALHTPEPAEELVAGPDAPPPSELPFPLRNSFAETGPYRVEAGDGQAAAGSMETRLAAIWADALQTDDPDPDANFFDLGGSSVLAPLIQDRIREACGVDIGAAGVFLYPTLRELTAVVAAACPQETQGGDDTQARMTAIWSAALQTGTPDPDANFFDLGGSSVLAPLIQDRIREACGVDIGAAGVFLYPTLRELTAVVAAARDSQPEHPGTQDKGSAPVPQSGAGNSETRDGRQAQAMAVRNKRRQQARRLHESFPIA